MWAPADWAALNVGDTDIGSISPAPVGGGLVFQSGKSGLGYLLNGGRLGGIGGQAFTGPVCAGGGAFGGTARLDPRLFVPCTSALVALSIRPGARFAPAWRGPATWPPIVAGGAVWALGRSDGVLHAVDPATGAERAHLTAGPSVHFATPASVGGLLVIAARASIVAVTGV